MRHLTILAAIGLLFMTAMPAAAQGQVKKFEVEPSLGLGMPLYGGGEGYHGKEGLSLGLEGRYNLESAPVSIGCELSISAASRRRDSSGSNSTANCHRTASLSVTSDYYFNRGGKVSPFVGVGVGLAQRVTTISDSEYVSAPMRLNPAGGVLTPRIGVEFWNHLRLTLDARIAGRDYSTVEFRIGYAFGGGKRQ